MNTPKLQSASRRQKEWWEQRWKERKMGMNHDRYVREASRDGFETEEKKGIVQV